MITRMQFEAVNGYLGLVFELFARTLRLPALAGVPHVVTRGSRPSCRGSYGRRMEKLVGDEVAGAD